MDKKKRVMLLICALSLLVLLSFPASADCACSPECSPGQTEWGGTCGECMSMRRDCDGACAWSGWSCVSNPPPGYGNSCGNCGTIGCSAGCVNEGVCAAASTQCNATRYQSCTSGCQWQGNGTDADADGTDLQCGDSLADNAPGVYDNTVTETEMNCTDGLDNDADNFPDCQDSECAGSLFGTVEDSSSGPIPDATVSISSGASSVATAYTNSSGRYAAGVNCGTYNLAVMHEDYAPLTQSGVAVPPSTAASFNFTGNNSAILAITCESDCTKAGDEQIHASCDGINGCAFYDGQAAQACDLAKAGWFRDYDEAQEVECPSGSPPTKVNI